MQGRQKQWVQEGRIPNLYTANIKLRQGEGRGACEPYMNLVKYSEDAAAARGYIKNNTNKAKKPYRTSDSTLV
jgi:hypothetical protein